MSDQNDGAVQNSDYSFSVDYSFTSILGTGAFLAGGYVGSMPFYMAAEKTQGVTKVALTGVGVAIDTTFSAGAQYTYENQLGLRDLPGLVVGAAASLYHPVAGVVAGFVTDHTVGYFVGAIEDLIALEDPDGGYNGKNIMTPGYDGYGQSIPTDVLRVAQEELGLKSAGVSLPVGYEMNELDKMSELARLSPDTYGHYAQSAPTADTIDEARKAMEIPGVYHDAIMRQAAGYGGTYTRDSGNDSGGSLFDGGSATGGSTYGAGGSTPGGWYSADNNYGGNFGDGDTTNDGSWSDDGWTDPNGYGVGPVVLDLDGDGVELSIGNGVAFDVDDDGYLENSTWAAADDGFLVIDLDADGTISESGGDGIIDQAAELAFSVWAAEEATDLQALAEATDAEGNLIFDSNGDGVLDASDDVWASMKVFQDLDQDGQVDEAELRTLDDWNISQINLSYDDGSGFEETDDNITILGNTLHGLGSFVRDGEAVEGGVGDVALSYTDPGWRRVETATGYQLEFESGVDWRFWDAEGQDAADFYLAAENYAGAYGDLRDNKLDASGSIEAVIIDGGAGNDSIVGGAGGDLLSGGDGADTIDGGAGDDIVFADAEDDVSVGNVQGGLGYDQLVMAEDAALSVSDLSAIGFEFINAGNVADLLVGLDDETGYYLAGNGGNDTLGAAGGNDVLSGGEGDDSLSGASGADLLSGGTGNDLLDAGDGSDTLAGGAGNDTLLGGEGNDRYFYWRGDGHDLIHDIATGTYLERETYEEQVKNGSGKNASYVNELRTGFTEASGQIDGGIDTLEFGYGLSVEDVLFSVDAGNALIEFRNLEDLETEAKEHDTVSMEDSVTIEDWVNQQSRIERFTFANGVTISTSQLLHGQTGHGSADLLAGTEDGDWLNAGSGNDTLLGEGGRDVLIAGDGADSLDGGAERDLIFTGAGDDVAYGGSGDDYLLGEDGNDTLDGGDGNDMLSGDAGNDELNGAAGADSLFGGTGDDSLNGGAGDDTYFFYRGDGHDTIHDFADETQDVEEATGNMVYQRSGKSGRYIEETRTVQRAVQIDGGWDALQFGYPIGLDHVFFELQGADLVMGVRQLDEDGNELTLEQFDDVVTVQDWTNELSRVEELRFGDGLDIDVSDFASFQSGYGSDDAFTGTEQNDLLSGGDGQDTLSGEAGDDILTGGAGNDLVSGGDGDDDLFGGAGDDTLSGGAGQDYILGGEGDDVLEGGDGDDVLTGGAGDDTLRGGLGNDIYHFSRGDGHDTIDESIFQVTENGVSETVLGPEEDFAVSLVSFGKDGAAMMWVNETRTGSTTNLLEGGSDTLQFGYYIDISDLIVNSVGSGLDSDLVVELAPTVAGELIEDSITIKNWGTSEFRIETFKFANGFTLDTSKIDSAVSGGAEDEVLAVPLGDYGIPIASWLSGAAGNDTLTGSGFSDILVGGVGDDRAEGGKGDDVYVFSRGDGADSILDTGSSSVGSDTNNPGGDKLLFGADISIEDLILQRDDTAMRIYVADKDNLDTPLAELEDVITVENWSSSGNRIEVFQFFDGVDYDVSKIVNTRLGLDLRDPEISEPVNDTLVGTSSGDWMDGFAGDDHLDGKDGADFLLGRDGDDTLVGGDGRDILSGGNGNDSLWGARGADVMSGGAGDDILQGRVGDDVMIGGSGNDTLDGGEDSDLIVGDLGDDVIIASAGQDQIRFGFGDGNDIYKGNSSFANTDVIVFEDDVATEDVWFDRIDNDLIVRMHGADDTITFENWYYGDAPKAYVQGFAADGKWLSYDQVAALVDVMGDHIAELNDGTTAYGLLPGEIPETVQTAIETAWT